MKSFFKDKFEYNNTSNLAVIQLIETNPESYSEKIQTLISHTINAHAIWNNRILQKEHHIGVWDRYQISELQALNDQNQAHSLAILLNTALLKQIKYVNSSGIPHTNNVNDILYHILNHSTYHRGQLMTQLKLEGIAPIATDFIIYKR